MTNDSSTRVRLTQERVVDAAIALVESEGLDALTIRRLAQDLGSSAMALYRHVDDREALLAAMLETASSPISDITSSADGVQERLVERFVLLHDWFVPRPWITRLLSRGDMLASSSMGFVGACFQDMIDAGAAPRDAFVAVGACWSLLLGELLDRHSEPPAKRPTQREQVLLSLDVREIPSLATIAENMDPADGPAPDYFEESLRALVTGAFATYV